MRKLLVRIVVGSIRQGRKSLAVAGYLHARLRERAELVAEVIDLADYPLPPLEERLSEENLLPAACGLCAQLGGADGLLLVAPEYKGGVPGALKNALDYLPQNYLRHKPVGICTVSAGGFGGMNCLAQLRLLTLALGGVPIPEFVAISKVNEVLAAGEGALAKAFGSGLEAFLGSLSWYCEALTHQRERDRLTQMEAPVAAWS
jgi:NAD(P)H-dependent FMN reductase